MVRPSERPWRSQVDQEVDVAGQGVVFSDDRTEHAHIACVSTRSRPSGDRASNRAVTGHIVLLPPAAAGLL
jgi:hypothetical protein